MPHFYFSYPFHFFNLCSTSAGRTASEYFLRWQHPFKTFPKTHLSDAFKQLFLFLVKRFGIFPLGRSLCQMFHPGPELVLKNKDLTLLTPVWVRHRSHPVFSIRVEDWRELCRALGRSAKPTFPMERNSVFSSWNHHPLALHHQPAGRTFRPWHQLQPVYDAVKISFQQRRTSFNFHIFTHTETVIIASSIIINKGSFHQEKNGKMWEVCF